MDMVHETRSRLDVRFPAKIGRRLTLLLGFLILVVLLVGGFSLYLAESISESTDRIRTITGRIEHTDHIHFLMHHAVEQANRTIMSGMASEADKVPQIISDLQEHVRHYKDLEADAPWLKGRPQYPMLRTIEEEITLLTDRVKQVTGSIAQGIKASQEDLASVRNLDDKMRKQFLKLNSLHQNDIAQELHASRRRMNLIAGIYLAFLVLGSLGLVGWNWAMSKSIVSPIRRLASATHEVASGNFRKRVPVTSTDEIGQLSHAFNAMAEKLEEHEEKLKGLAVLEERERIAREMHDGLAQVLGSVLFKMRSGPLRDLPDADARGAIHEVERLAEDAYSEVRQSIFGLRTVATRNLDLIPTLAEYLHDFGQQSGIAIDLQVPHQAAIRLSPQAEIQLIRVIQEALTNVRRHAQARGAWISFRVQGEELEVVIGDDGRGFDLAEVQARARGHFGLQTMRERTQVLGGKFDIETAPRKGTKVHVTLPLVT
ncbi:MAG: HAMP domain-containing protein [Candidatus Binatia bacterium]